MISCYCASFAARCLRGRGAGRRPLACFAGVILLLPAPTIAEQSAAWAGTIKPLLEAKCYDCHAEGAKKGGVSFDEFTTEAELMADTKLWHRVLKNVRDGLMPPPEKDQPTKEENLALQAWIKAEVFKLDPAQPDPGRPTLRRLNRTEYRNTIRDLTGLNFPVDDEFPADDTGHGFDNIGEVLTLSPMLLEKYLAAAKSIVQQAVPQVARVMPEIRVDGDDFHRMDTIDGVVTRGPSMDTLSYYHPLTVATTVDIKKPGRYTIMFELGGQDRFVEGISDLNRCRLRFFLDGEEMGQRDFGYVPGIRFNIDYPRALTIGAHEISIAVERLTPNEKEVRSLALHIHHVLLRGPDDEAAWEPPANHAKWFPRPVPTEPAARHAYAAEVLGAFATRAFRRPLQNDTVKRLADLAASVWSEPSQCFESGVSRAMEAVLASPRFLFLEETTEPQREGETHPRIDEYSLASRLSYFLWSTMPDAELLELAGTGKLRENVKPQLARMLADEKSQAFFRNFPGQWLQARDIEAIPIDARSVLRRDQKPDPEIEEARRVFMELRTKESTELTADEQASMEKARAVFRRSNDRLRDADFPGNLRRDMRRETEQYFEYVIRHDRPLTELIDSDYTFLNERLAQHYGVPGVQGDDLVKVILPAGSPRGGILTQGSVLAVTSNPTRTSPVKRGLFILDNILGTPPPPPPPDIPSLEDNSGRGRPSEFTLRETLLRHRADAQCASCHNRMDPIGLAFENFNAMGQWRESERGKPVDTSGQLISGETFPAARELKKILVANHRDAFHRCFIEKLLLYALGRGLDHRDETTVDLLMDVLAKHDGKPSALLISLVESDAFQRRRLNRPGQPAESK